MNWNRGDLGGRVPFADPYVRFFHGHNSGFQDAPIPIEERKKTAGNGTFYFTKAMGNYRQSGRFMLRALDESKKPAKHNCTELFQIQPSEEGNAPLVPKGTIWVDNFENRSTGKVKKDN